MYIIVIDVIILTLETTTNYAWIGCWLVSNRKEPLGQEQGLPRRDH